MKLLLGACQVGFKGKVVSIEQDDFRMFERIQELGFMPGGEVEVLHEAPFFKDPIAVRVRGSIVAIRRQEANLLLVSPLSEKKVSE